MTSIGRPRSKMHRVYSLTAIVIITFIMFIIFSNIRTSWVDDDISDVGTLLSDPSGTAMQSEVVMDDDGNALAIWLQYDGSEGRYDACARPFIDGEWGDVVEIEQGDMSVDSIQVVMDADGHAIAVWSQSDDSGYLRIYANIYFEGTWAGVTELDGYEGNCLNPMVSMNDNGEAFVFWSQEDGSINSTIRVCFYAEGIWSAPTTIVDTIGTFSNKGIAMNSDGDAVVVWCQGNGSGGYQLHAVMFSGGSWGNVSTIDGEGAEHIFDVEVCMDSGGDVVMIWQQLNMSCNSDILYSICSDGSWTMATPLEQMDGYAEGPGLVMDDDGNAIAVWAHLSGSYSVYVSFFSNGSWGTPELIEDDPGQSYIPRIGMDGDGNAIVAWSLDPGSGSYSICTVRYTNGSWEDTVTIGENMGMTGCVDVVIDGDRTIIMWLYLDIDNGIASIYATPDEGDDSSSISWLVIPAVLIAFAMVVTGLTSWKHRND